MLLQKHDLNPSVSRPFNPFIILSSRDQTVLFFSQSFAQLSRFHPCTVPSSIQITDLKELNLDIIQCQPIDRYEVFHFKQKNSPNSNGNYWVEDLIHELRTASLAIDLGAHVLAENEDLAPILLRKLLRASHRQKISTLIASDFLQFLTSAPLVYPVPLTNILTKGISHSPLTSQVQIRLTSSTTTDVTGHINPIIMGNYHFLTNFFTTVLSWLEIETVMVEMEIINPVSVQVIINIPHNHFLSNIQGYSIVPHYLHHIASYFNGRSWITQNSINILFPLVISSRKEKKTLGHTIIPIHK